MVKAIEDEIRYDLAARSVFTLFMNRYIYSTEDGFYTRGRVESLDREFEIIIEHELGKVDLNRADLDTLSLVFAASGQEAEAAKRLAAAIIDWRDPDSDPYPNYGQEEEAYIAQDKRYLPRNGAFEGCGRAHPCHGHDRYLV